MRGSASTVSAPALAGTATLMGSVKLLDSGENDQGRPVLVGPYAAPSGVLTPALPAGSTRGGAGTTAVGPTSPKLAPRPRAVSAPPISSVARHVPGAYRRRQIGSRPSRHGHRPVTEATNWPDTDASFWLMVVGFVATTAIFAILGMVAQ